MADNPIPEDLKPLRNRLLESSWSFVGELLPLFERIFRLENAIDEVLVSNEVGIFKHGDDPAKVLRDLVSHVAGFSQAILRTRIDELEARTLSCVFCGEPMASVEALKAHSADCPKHPAVIENAKLKAQVERLSDPVTSVEEISSLATFDNALRNHCGRKQSENAMEQALGWLIASRSAGKEERTTYPHEGHCSCSSYLPVGSPGCCCNRKRMEEHHA